MSAMFRTLLRTVILDSSAYEDWHERPNLFVRGIVLIAIVSLVAGLLVFAVDVVNRVKPVDAAKIQQELQKGFDSQYQWNPALKNLPPEVRAMIGQQIAIIGPMVADLAKIEAPLPRGVSGLFEAVGAYLSRVLAALGGWMLYGALVLVAVNLLGGTAKLPDFLGMTSLYSIPGLLALLSPIPCLGGLLAFVGTIWSIVVYVKAVSVASRLDGARSIVAVFSPLIAIVLVSVLLVGLVVIWLVIVL
jgi:hypothetical protein